MLTALFTFLGGSAFRLIFGAVMDAWTKHQDQALEMRRLELQARLDAERHARDLETLRLQAELGVKQATVKGDYEVQVKELDALTEAVRATREPSGITFVDAWNGVIRPLGASIAILLWVASIYARHGALVEFDMALMGSFLGVFTGDRIARKMGRPA